MISLLWSKFSGYILAIGAALGIILGAYLKGRSDQKETLEKRDLKDLKKGLEIDEKVSQMPVSELDRNLDRWMRD